MRAYIERGETTFFLRLGMGHPATRDVERMRDVFDIFTIIIFLALAVFIFLQLRSVLGRRTSRERPPYEVTLPSRPAKAPHSPGKGLAAAGRPLEGYRRKRVGRSGRAGRDRNRGP